ncbi:hypothetical protein NT6N_24800 [Oceaniferula spumae]|uniref:Uncharacterized protein n=1 Tax=Oceaniferula spumae TaxID=2979115 RepID=A0AAT9FN74_9BACT
MSDVSIEFTLSGFTIRTRKFLWFYNHYNVIWDEVHEIRAEMKDCVSFHTLGLRFMISSDEGYLVCDDDAIWTELYEKVLEIFPAIDRDVIAKAEASFPNECSLICWQG